jgi:hypothetical protein
MSLVVFSCNAQNQYLAETVFLAVFTHVQRLLDPRTPHEAANELRRLERMPRKRVKGQVQVIAQHVHGMLQNVPYASEEDLITFICNVSNLARRHRCLREEMTKSPCQEVLMSMLQAASQHEGVYKNFAYLESVCLAQCSLGIANTQF